MTKMGGTQSTVSSAMKLEIATTVDKLIKDNTVAMFSKSYCPYCTKSKRLLNDAGVTFVTVELDQRENGAAMQDILQTKTGQRTVPNIFVRGTHLGGNDDLHGAQRNGRLAKLLEGGND